jgi:hypothetical protein
MESIKCRQSHYTKSFLAEFNIDDSDVQNKSLFVSSNKTKFILLGQLVIAYGPHYFNRKELNQNSNGC